MPVDFPPAARLELLGRSHSTDNMPAPSRALDPGLTGALQDVQLHPLAGLLHLAPPPKIFWTALDCAPGHCIGRVEINRTARILTLVTAATGPGQDPRRSVNWQADKNLQLHIQFAIVDALPCLKGSDQDDPNLSLHQNHEPPPPPGAASYGLKHESERDLQIYHTLGLPHANGARLNHYHVQFEKFDPDALRGMLFKLANTSIDGLPVLSPGDAARVYNAATPFSAPIQAEAMTAAERTPLLPPFLSEVQRAQARDRWQEKYERLCRFNHLQATANQARPEGQRQLRPVNTQADPAGYKRAVELACLRHGHTHAGLSLHDALHPARLKQIYGSADGVLHLADLRKFLASLPGRFDDPAIRAQVTQALLNIDHVLGRKPMSRL